MILDTIVHNIRSPIVSISGSLNTKIYIQSISEPVANPYPQWLVNTNFQQENARASQMFVLHWPALSSDLSSIELIFDKMGTRLNILCLPPNNLSDYPLRIQETQKKMPQVDLNHLIDRIRSLL